MRELVELFANNTLIMTPLFYEDGTRRVLKYTYEEQYLVSRDASQLLVEVPLRIGEERSYHAEIDAPEDLIFPEPFEKPNRRPRYPDI